VEVLPLTEPRRLVFFRAEDVVLLCCDSLREVLPPRLLGDFSRFSEDRDVSIDCPREGDFPLGVLFPGFLRPASLDPEDRGVLEIPSDDRLPALLPW
jgi:hypothetical protein